MIYHLSIYLASIAQKTEPARSMSGPPLLRADGMTETHMKRNPLLSALCLFVAISGCQKNIVPTNTIAISHVTVIDATGAPARMDQTVLLEGERMKQIG